LTRLVWTKTFVRAYRRMAQHDLQLRKRIEKTLLILIHDPMHPSLRTHKLKGELAGVWACSVDYDVRILFELVPDPDTQETDILLLTLGTHDEVY
jgi:addiction module RelE/StbE family toxin